MLTPAPGTETPDTASIITDLDYDGTDSFVSDMEDALSSVSKALDKQKKIAINDPPSAESSRDRNKPNRPQNMITIMFDMRMLIFSFRFSNFGTSV